MRSSKSRSRSKPNRPRTLGNITNRVFDSSGPEGKVRGTPQQIIDKYLVLAREAQLSNDRVSAESCMQFAEHYTRMLGEATREMQAEQDARRLQESQNQPRDYQPRDRGDGQQPDLRDTRADNGRNENTRSDNGRSDGGRSDNGRSDGGRDDDRSNMPRDDRNGERNTERSPERSPERNNERRDAPRDDRSGERRNRQVQRPDQGAAAAVIEPPKGEEDSGLVETPETHRPRQHRQPRPKPAEDTSATPAVAVAPKAAPKPAEEAAPEAEKPPRKPRVARKPKGDAPDTSGKEAAE